MDSATPQAPPREFLGGFGIKLYRYKTLVRRLWWVLAITMAAGAAFEGWMVYRQPQTFESVSELNIREQLNMAEDAVKFQQQVDNFIANTESLLKSPEVLERARRQVALKAPQLTGPMPDINTNVLPRTTIFTITGTGRSPELTQLYTDAVVAEFIDFRREQERGVVGDVANGLYGQASKLGDQLKQEKAAFQEFITKNNMPFWEEQAQSRAKFLSGLKDREANLRDELQRLQTLTPDQLLAAPQPQGKSADAGAGNGVANRSGLGGGATGTSDTPANGELYTIFIDLTQDLSKAQSNLDERSKVWKPRHPKLIALKATVDEIKHRIESLQTQNKDLITGRIDAIQAELKSLAVSIETTSKTVLEASGKDAEYKTLQQEIAHSQELLDGTSKRADELGATKTVPDIFSVLQAATPGREVPKKALNHLLTGIIGGFVIGILILVLLDRTDDRMASSSEILERFTEPILGQIPNVAESRGAAGLPLLQPEDERYSYAEAFRSLRSSLIFMPNQSDLKTLLVTSAIPNEGKSTVASNLAVTMAAAGAKVVLVDADLRRGDLASLFDTDGRTGLSNILRGEVTWESTLRKTVYPSLSLIPRGPVTNQSGELLLLPTVDALLDDLKSNFDLVIFNTAPILATDDTPTLAPHFEGTLMIVRAAFTSSRLTQNALNALYQRQVSVLGLILNCVDAEMPDYYYYRYPKYYAA